MKKFLLFLMCGILLLTIVGCGQQPNATTKVEDSITDTKEEVVNDTNTEIVEEESETNTDVIENQETNETKKEDAETSKPNATDKPQTGNKNETENNADNGSSMPTATKDPTVKAETTEPPETTPEPISQTPTPTKTNHTPTEMELEVLRLINIEREKVGAGKLTYNSGIYECGVIRAKECLVKWSHTRPNGTKYWTVFEECGKTITTCCGENLAKTFTSAEQIMTVLMNSESHKNNILYKDFTSVCITILQNDDGYYYMSQLFMGK